MHKVPKIGTNRKLKHKKMIEKLKLKIEETFFSQYTDWSKLILTQDAERYRIVIQRRNIKTGMFQFKSIFIAEISELPLLTDLEKLIK